MKKRWTMRRALLVLCIASVVFALLLQTFLFHQSLRRQIRAESISDHEISLNKMQTDLSNFIHTIHLDLTTRVNLVQNLLKTKELPVKTGAALLDINRTSVYYKGTPISQEELDCKSIIDRLHTDNPAWGARQLSAQLKKRGYQVGRRKTRRYMSEMGIDPIYPKMNLSKRMQQAKVCPYLLRNAVIDRPNQAWSINITYIPIKRGFLYLTAVIDWYSRCIVGWEVDDTLDTRMVITALKKAFMVAKPVILNSDQGCQFTSNEYMNFLKENQICQCMDGKSRWADNIMIERWFRSFKYERL